MIDNRVEERDGEIYKFSGERYRDGKGKRQRKRRKKKQRQRDRQRKTLKKSSPYSNIKKHSSLCKIF